MEEGAGEIARGAGPGRPRLGVRDGGGEGKDPSKGGHQEGLSLPPSFIWGVGGGRTRQRQGGGHETGLPRGPQARLPLGDGWKEAWDPIATVCPG